MKSLNRGFPMLCWTRYLFILVVIVLGTGSMLSACGQKGPLVLPEKSQQTESQQTESQQTGSQQAEPEQVETGTEQQPE